MMRLLCAAALFLSLCASQAAAQGRVFATDGCIEKKPQTPRALKASAESNQITVTWRSPDGDACVDTFDYTVVQKGQKQGRSATPKQVSSYSLTVADLKPNTQYEISISAVNSVKGASPPAAISVTTPQAKCTDKAPGEVREMYFNQQSKSTVFLTWLPPQTGGCARNYKIEGFDPRGNRVLNAASTVPEAIATNLIPGKQYTFHVTPINKKGQGPMTRHKFLLDDVVATGSVPAGRRLLRLMY